MNAFMGGMLQGDHFYAFIMSSTANSAKSNYGNVYFSAHDIKTIDKNLLKQNHLKLQVFPCSLPYCVFFES